MDAGEGVTRLTYNAFGYPEKIISPLVGVKSICYNNFNLPISRQDENNIVTTYRYNAAGLIDQVSQTHEGTTLSYPLGYPDGWNALAYCGNRPGEGFDLFGCSWWPFGNDETNVLFGFCMGDYQAIPGCSGTDILCGETKTFEFILTNMISLNIKFTPTLSPTITCEGNSIQSAWDILTKTLDMKPFTKKENITWQCHSIHHEKDNDKRGCANVRLFIRPYIDIYAVYDKDRNFLRYEPQLSLSYTTERVFLTIRDYVERNCVE